MRSDDDWNLQAMYNEPLRIRSKSNYELWNKIDQLYYNKEEPKAQSGVQQEYIELFINDSYRGVYALSEKVDRKQLKLKKYKDEEIRGELYKAIAWGPTQFYSTPIVDSNSKRWGGYKYNYPKDEINWSNIYEFVDFVINEDSVSFYNTYKSKFSVNNAVNYFIFLNLIRATDNTGKNLYVAKYDKYEPYFFVPWDLDGSFGVIWNGTHENITNDILTNGFYTRLLSDNTKGGFTDKLTKRWNQLRKETLTVESILKTINTHHNYLKSNGVYEREQRAWKDCNKYLDLDNLHYTSEWLENRFNYLDSIFNNPNLLANKETTFTN